MANGADLLEALLRSFAPPIHDLVVVDRPRVDRRLSVLRSSGFSPTMARLAHARVRITLPKQISLLVGWLAAFAIVVLRATCCIRHHADPRPELGRGSRRFAYSILHAHQVAAIIDGQPGTGAMVSRSADGGIIIPSLLARGIIPMRGSADSKGRDKGGRTAFRALIEHVLGGAPAYLAVDGPRGPRNRVHKGIALLSQLTGAAVLNIIPVPNRRWILSGTWDRLQIPKPFTTIHIYFGEPIFPREREEIEHYRQRIERSLNDLESKHDLAESKCSQRRRSTPHTAPALPLACLTAAIAEAA